MSGGKTDEEQGATMQSTGDTDGPGAELYTAQCAFCKVRCHCIFYGPGIRYSDIFGAPGIRYSVIIKLPCALLQTGHLETVHAPVADTVAYFADLDAPVVDTVTYFGGNHRSRV